VQEQLSHAQQAHAQLAFLCDAFLSLAKETVLNIIKAVTPAKRIFFIVLNVK
jgi:hypothetical protein